MDKRKKLPDLGTEAVDGLIWRFAIPGIISQVMNAVYNVVDQIFIGRGVADIAIGASNVALPLSSVITAVSALVGMGAAACFNLAVGRRQEEQARATAGGAVTMLVGSGLLICLLALVFLKPLLVLFGATDAIMGYAYPYARIIAVGIPFGIFATGTSYLIRADGDPNFSMNMLLAGAVFNLAADPFFLFVCRMGIAGIALATTLGQVLSAALALWYLRRKFRTVRLRKTDFRLRPRLAGSICVSGSAIFMTHLCAIAVQILQNNSLKHYGALCEYGSEIPLAAVGAVSKVSVLLMSMVIGIALGCQPIYGFNFGRKNYERVKKTYLRALLYATAVSVTAFLCLQLFPRWIVALFGAGDELFYDFARRYIRIYLLLLFTGGLLPVSSTFFTAIGKPKYGMLLTVLKQVVLLLPLTVLLPLRWGITGVLAAGPVTDGVITVTVLLFALREIRRLNRMAQETEMI